MRKLFFFILLFVSNMVFADNAKAILDKASAQFKASGNVKIGFQITANNQNTIGYINIAANKFYCDMAGVDVWFDGTTMWHYVKADGEVSVTTPTAKNLAKMNPYFFLSIYKKGYKCKMGKSTKEYYEVVMSGGKDTDFSSITVRLNRKNYNPLYTKTVSKKNTIEIKINSFLPHQSFDASSFRFNPKEFPGVEVIDLR